MKTKLSPLDFSRFFYIKNEKKKYSSINPHRINLFRTQVMNPPQMRPKSFKFRKRRRTFRASFIPHSPMVLLMRHQPSFRRKFLPAHVAHELLLLVMRRRAVFKQFLTRSELNVTIQAFVAVNVASTVAPSQSIHFLLRHLMRLP